MLWGLGVLLVVLLFVALTIEVILRRIRGLAINDGNVARVQRMTSLLCQSRSVMMSVVTFTIFAWFVAAVLTAVTTEQDLTNDAGQLQAPEEPPTPSSGTNSPEAAKTRLREDGLKNQKESMDDLDAFRKDFFERRKQKK